MVEHWDEQQWGELNEQKMREQLRAEGYSTIVRYVYTPGTEFGEHTHPVEKKDVVLDGELRVVIDEEDYVLLPGDAIVIPADKPHTAYVVGASDVISLDASREE